MISIFYLAKSSPGVEYVYYNEADLEESDLYGCIYADGSRSDDYGYGAGNTVELSYP